MTEAEATWLKLLRDEGPQSIAVLHHDYPGATGCLGKGWTEWSGDPDQPEKITPSGFAELERWQ